MKRFCSLFLVLVVINISVSIADAQTLIPDENLQAAIRETLDIRQGRRITVAHLESLTTLNAPNSEISDLTGLEYATGLKFLYISRNSIESFQPLTDLVELCAVTRR